MENQSIQQENKNLINKVRKNSNKKKRSFKWVSILWLFGVIAIAVLIVFLVFNAIRPIQHDPYSQIINVTLTSDDTYKNSEEIQKLKFPSDFVDYNLIIKNDLQLSYDIYLRFKALTYVDGQMQLPNIMEFKMVEENKNNFYYDSESDYWYYLGKIERGEDLVICEKIGVSPYKTGNQYANKTVNFYVAIEAIRVNENPEDIAWGDESSVKWKQIMTERHLFEQTEESQQ